MIKWVVDASKISIQIILDIFIADVFVVTFRSAAVATFLKRGWLHFKGFSNFANSMLTFFSGVSGQKSSGLSCLRAEMCIIHLKLIVSNIIAALFQDITPPRNLPKNDCSFMLTTLGLMARLSIHVTKKNDPTKLLRRKICVGKENTACSVLLKRHTSPVVQLVPCVQFCLCPPFQLSRYGLVPLPISIAIWFPTVLVINFGLGFSKIWRRGRRIIAQKLSLSI